MEHGELVGRDQEIATLCHWLKAAVDRHPRLVLCGGEPGIGKTALASELSRIAETMGVPPRWARAQEGVGAPPYWLWQQALRSNAVQSAFPYGVSTARADDVFGPGTERFTLFDTVTRMLFEQSEPAGLLLVLDDVHWAISLRCCCCGTYPRSFARLR